MCFLSPSEPYFCYAVMRANILCMFRRLWFNMSCDFRHENRHCLTNCVFVNVVIYLDPNRWGPWEGYAKIYIPGGITPPHARTKNRKRRSRQWHCFPENQTIKISMGMLWFGSDENDTIRFDKLKYAHGLSPDFEHSNLWLPVMWPHHHSKSATSPIFESSTF